MPQFIYRGRDRGGHLRVGQRFAFSADNLGIELIKEGISPIQIKLSHSERSYLDKFHDWAQGETLHLQELAIFSRQMELLHKAGVPMVTALKQLAAHTRSYRLAHALHGVIEHLEKGQSLSSAMYYYPEAFSPLIINVIQIGENTGHLSEAFAHLHSYLEFEASSTKQIKSAFRYPIFVSVSIIFAIIILNIFVIPTFAKFYVGLTVSLPWQTRLLIGISNSVVDYGMYLLVVVVASSIMIYRYVRTPQGRYRWNHYALHIPFIGNLLKRIILIRFAQSLSIILTSGISVTQGLTLVKNIINNTYIGEQISRMQEGIERGVPFTQALTKIELFTPLEIQILGVGEKNGELSPALNYISNFHGQEIEFDLKRMNDWIGPIMITAISILILIIALGVYLPIWNMINLVH